MFTLEKSTQKRFTTQTQSGCFNHRVTCLLLPTPSFYTITRDMSYCTQPVGWNPCEQNQREHPVWPHVVISQTIQQSFVCIFIYFYFKFFYVIITYDWQTLQILYIRIRMMADQELLFFFFSDYLLGPAEPTSFDAREKYGELASQLGYGDEPVIVHSFELSLKHQIPIRSPIHSAPSHL